MPAHRIIDIDFSQQPESATIRVPQALRAFIASAQVPMSHFQNEEQLLAWREDRIYALEGICRRIVGTAITEEFRSHIDAQVKLLTELLAEALQVCKFAPGSPAHHMVAGTIGWLHTHYPA